MVVETYRSGHNGTDSKSVVGQPTVGSNPTVSAKKMGVPLGAPIFLHIKRWWDSKGQGVNESPFGLSELVPGFSTEKESHRLRQAKNYYIDTIVSVKWFFFCAFVAYYMPFCI